MVDLHYKVIDKADWCISYMNNQQERALARCLFEKYKKDKELFSNILYEIELCQNPEEYSCENIIESIKDMINNREGVYMDVGGFSWEAE